MKIAICGSMQFAKDMLTAKTKLEAMGHTVFIPHGTEAYARESIAIEDKWKKLENDVIREWYAVIKDSDAVLVLNYTKNDIQNYIGGNALIEMAFAYVLYKRIFLLNPIPTLSYSDEIGAFSPIMLNGSLENLGLVGSNVVPDRFLKR